MARATRIALDLALAASKFGRYHASIAWQYLKQESVPPMTVSFFNGPIGRKLDSVVSGVVNKIIDAIETTIQNMDAAEAKKQRDKEAAILAAQELARAEELKKKEAAANKAQEAKMAKEAETKKKEEKAEPAKKEEKEPKKDPPKSEKKK